MSLHPVEESKPTLADRVRGWWDADYAARAAVARRVAARPWIATGDRSDRQRRTGGSTSEQPFGPNGVRTLTPQKRRHMVQVARKLDETSYLASSMLDRCVDNIIGTGMTLQATTDDPGYNRAVEELWKLYGTEIDSRYRLKSHGHWQRAFFRAYKRDGDMSGMLLTGGSVQAIESDYIQTPGGPNDRQGHGAAGKPDIIDGVEINEAGRPVAYHVALQPSNYRTDYRRVAARNVVFMADNDRLDRAATRGVPCMAMMGGLIEQIEDTVEAVVVAHRMAAMFGLFHKKNSPANAYNSLKTTAMNTDGNQQPEFVMEPGMVLYGGLDDELQQIKPEHPTSQFNAFSSQLVRFAGLKLGLPLELAMLDFSKTNYSSARASMEQAYRRFGIERKMFADCCLDHIYRWRVSKWIKEGLLPERDDAWKHRWLGQPWPYLDPQKEADADLMAVDSNFTLLSDVLMKRGIDFDDFIERKREEIEMLDAANIPMVHSSRTRENKEPGTQNEQSEIDE